MKCGGITGALEILNTARAFNLKTMIGCMSESSISIGAGAALTGIIDHIDLDSHLNLKPDIATGLQLKNGMILPMTENHIGHGSILKMKKKLNSSHRLAIYMPHSLTHENGKMGLGILRFSTNEICCVIDPDHKGKNLKALTGIDKSIPIVSDLQEAIELRANALILGIAPSGGRLPDTWTKPIEDALTAGFLVVNGLHDKLADKFSYLLSNPTNKGSVWDVREVLKEYTIGSAKANELKNKRILTVGTDMASGKMTAGLMLNEKLLQNNFSSSFVATGQIGITISGQGIPLDAIKVDNAAAAVEDEVMSRQKFDHIIIEGQGSLGHPGSTATLPLMRGSCPTHLFVMS